ncbi:MAG: mechanosensitive ion channel domain-containing protein [Desulfopila sp.]|jgi:miniconductance mechanosensitive channel|nr:mechanosensitive ion channel domain-containing protein [Desulfopila sp.]
MNTEWLAQRLTDLDIPAATAQGLALLVLFFIVAIIAATVTYIVRKTLFHIVLQWIERKHYTWGSPLIRTNFFIRASWLVPLAIFSLAVDSLLEPGSPAYLLLRRLLNAGFVIVAIQTLNALLTAVKEIDVIARRMRHSILAGYTDALRIAAYVVGIIFIISIFSGRSPWGILSVLGGLTAVLLLIFKDSILGFVASLQLGASDLVRVGDWIEMPQYGADGDVISLSIHTVRVQNFDKTISTIPTYALVSNSFKNWRGMQESKGRRIKRPLYIDLHSIRFCDEEMIARLSRIEILKKYIQEKENEIESHNAAHLQEKRTLLNGRRQTNIGIFRAYIAAYLRNNENINQNMTFLIRQLAPTDHGLPLEIYVFSKDQIWAHYEAIQADIFDHLLAAVSEFDLRVFQIPSGFDLRSIRKENA